MKLKKLFKDFYDEICIHEESENLKKKRNNIIINPNTRIPPQ